MNHAITFIGLLSVLGLIAGLAFFVLGTLTAIAGDEDSHMGCLAAVVGIAMFIGSLGALFP